MYNSKRSYSPLSPERIAILVALASGPLDRSQIAVEVIGDTIGSLVLSKTSYYRYIRELEAEKYIEQNVSYNLTEKGWRTLRQELARIEQQRRLLKQRLHA